jgi:hypothetical protein
MRSALGSAGLVIVFLGAAAVAGRAADGRSQTPGARGTAPAAERFAERLQQSTRPTRYIGSFRSADSEITLTDTGFALQRAAGTSCYWFGQVEGVEADVPARGQAPGLLAWRRDDVRPIAMAAPPGDRGEFATFRRALQTAQRAWVAKYGDVTARLKSASQTGGFAALASQGRSGWYNEKTKSVACNDTLSLQNAAQLPGGLRVGGKWVGTMDAVPAELLIVSASSATITYSGVKETLEVQIQVDGEIILRGVSHEFLPGVPSRPFNLDTFRGRLSADSKTMAGTWKDTGDNSGAWSLSRAEP